MTTYFITRHAGALDWASRRGLTVDQRLTHLDPNTIQPGDHVLGTLPVHLAADVHTRGGFYHHLSLDLPPDLRGKEISADDMMRCGATLEPFTVLTGHPPR